MKDSDMEADKQIKAEIKKRREAKEKTSRARVP